MRLDGLTAQGHVRLRVVEPRTKVGHCSRCGLRSADELCPLCRREDERRLKMAEIWTDAKLTTALMADLEKPQRRAAPTNLHRLREEQAAARKAIVAAARSERPRGHLLTEKHPGQLRMIRNQVRGGDYSGLSAAACAKMALIASRPDVSRSRRWTTAKKARLTFDADQARWHFQEWLVDLARHAKDRAARRAATEKAAAIARQADDEYKAFTAAHAREARSEARRYRLARVDHDGPLRFAQAWHRQAYRDYAWARRQFREARRNARSIPALWDRLVAAAAECNKAARAVDVAARAQRRASASKDVERHVPGLAALSV